MFTARLLKSPMITFKPVSDEYAVFMYVEVNLYFPVTSSPPLCLELAYQS